MTSRQLGHICGPLLNIAIPLGMLTAIATGTFQWQKVLEIIFNLSEVKTPRACPCTPRVKTRQRRAVQSINGR